MPVFVIPALLCLWLFAAAGLRAGARRLAARVLPAPAAGRRARRARPRRAGAAGVAGLAARRPRRSQRRSAGRAPGRAAVRRAAAAIGHRLRRLHRRSHAAVRAARPRPAARPRHPHRRRATPRRCGRCSPPRSRSSPSRRPSIGCASTGLDFSATPVRAPRRHRSPLSSRGCRAARSSRWRCRPRTRARFAPTAKPARRRARRGRPPGRPRLRARRRRRRLDAGARGLSPEGDRRRPPHAAGRRRRVGTRAQRARGRGGSRARAAIRLGGRDLVRTAEGVAVAVWGPDGRLLRAAALQAADGYLVPVPAGAVLGLSADRRRGRAGAAAGTRGSTSRPRRTAAAHVRDPAGAPARALRERRRPARASGAGATRAAARSTSARFVSRSGEVVAPPLSNVDRGRAGGASRRRRPRRGTPVAVVRDARRHAAARGGPHRVGRARHRRIAARRGDRRAPARAGSPVRGGPMTRDDQARLIGAGWSDVETDDAGPYRWMTATARPGCVLPGAIDGLAHADGRGLPADGDGPAAIGVRVERRDAAAAAGPGRVAHATAGRCRRRSAPRRPARSTSRSRRSPGRATARPSPRGPGGGAHAVRATRAGADLRGRRQMA